MSDFKRRWGSCTKIRSTFETKNRKLNLRVFFCARTILKNLHKLSIKIQSKEHFLKHFLREKI